MITLTRGANCQVPQEIIDLSVKSTVKVDFCAFMLGNNGKIRADSDFLFYNNPCNENRSASMEYTDFNANYKINIGMLSPTVEKVVFALVNTSRQFSRNDSIDFKLMTSNAEIAEGVIETENRSEAAIIIGELYRYKGAWKYRCIDQGFDGGLKPLAEYFGVEIIEDDAAIPPSHSAPQPFMEEQASTEKVNLSKVVLTKEKPKIDLKKKSDSFGKIRVNLNWNTGTGTRSSLFGFRKKSESGVDLDLGAYIKFKNGDQTIVQAIGNRFGDLQREPYVKLLGDDRTGATAEGEWLEVNGNRLDQISEIVIFTFIYEGVANWKQTDGKVTIFVDGHPPVETILSEGSDDLGMCAIARLKNNGGDISIERINRYFSGHKAMDRAFGWGFSWVRGSK